MRFSFAQNILPGSLPVHINKLKYYATLRISLVREYAGSVPSCQRLRCHRILLYNKDADIGVFVVDEIPDTNIC